MRNSSVTIQEQLVSLFQNCLTAMNAINKVVISTDSQIAFESKDAAGNSVTTSLPSVGYFQSELEMLRSSLSTLAGVDQRGATIQTARNEYKRIIVSNTNREPNPMQEIGLVSNFYANNNHFFESLLNPLLKVRLDLSGKVDASTRRVLSRRYIVAFEKDASGEYTAAGSRAIDLFNDQFKNKTNIDLSALEAWVLATAGVAVGEAGNKVEFDEQEFDLEPNRLQYEGFFTILGTDEDVINRKMYYVLDTLDYFEIESKSKQSLKLGDVLTINSKFATTQLRVVEINKDASDIKVRFELIEGMEPMPISVVGGLKLFSALVDQKKVDITIGFNEYNVLFIKPINTENHIVARRWSLGVAFFTNNLSLASGNALGDNGKNLTEFYIQSVSDFGALLKDLVARDVPRNLGIVPRNPVLIQDNFHVVQVNKHLTDSPALEANRKRHAAINTNRSKLDALNKTIEDKRKELISKSFKTPKDRLAVQNQIDQLVKESGSVSEAISSTVNEILANNQNDSNATAKYRVQGFWSIPAPQPSTKTRPQHVVAFRVQFKYSSKNGEESPNEIFKVLQSDGKEINAIFSPWDGYITDIRERVFDVATQKWEWAEEDLSSIERPNVNSLSLALSPNEKVDIRIKSISEVGYPDALLESEWSNTLTVKFDDALLNGRNPQDAILKNAELESVRNRILSDLSSLNLNAHLADSFTSNQNKFYPHIDVNIAHRETDGTFVSVSDKLKQLESGDFAETEHELAMASNWNNHGGDFESAKYYRNQRRVFLSGVIRIDNNNPDVSQRFVEVVVDGNTNSQYAVIGTLPDGYQPNKKMSFMVVTKDNSYARIDIDHNGNIVLVHGNTAFISLNGISFRF